MSTCQKYPSTEIAMTFIFRLSRRDIRLGGPEARPCNLWHSPPWPLTFTPKGFDLFLCACVRRGWGRILVSLSMPQNTFAHYKTVKTVKTERVFRVFWPSLQKSLVSKPVSNVSEVVDFIMWKGLQGAGGWYFVNLSIYTYR